MVELSQVEQPLAEEFRAAQKQLRDVETAVLTARYQFARQMGLTFNGKRDMMALLGYENVITPRMYRDRYERGGIAGAIVDARPDATWRGEGELIETGDVKVPTEFEKAWYAMNDEHKVWPTFQRADKLAGLGEHAVILIGAEGDLSQELPKATKPDALLYLQPYDDEDATIDKFVTDKNDRRFGRPLKYTLKRNSTNAHGSPTSEILAQDVHWSRVIHVPAEGFLDDEIYGPPALQRVWNYLNDLEKVAGGGSESFWQRANQITHFDMDKDVAYKDENDMIAQIKLMKEKAEAVQHQLTRWIETRGVQIKNLGSDVASFKDPVDALMKLIAGSKRIPMRLLTGSEMGTLASTQDDENWKTQISDRRTSYAGPYIARQWADRMLKYGFLPKPKEYSVKWPDVKDMSMIERLAAAETAAKLNDHGQIVITNDEIREKFLDMNGIDQNVVDEINGIGIGTGTGVSNPNAVQQLAAALRKGGTLSIAVRP